MVTVNGLSRPRSDIVLHTTFNIGEWKAVDDVNVDWDCVFQLATIARAREFSAGGPVELGPLTSAENSCDSSAVKVSSSSSFGSP